MFRLIILAVQLRANQRTNRVLKKKNFLEVEYYTTLPNVVSHNLAGKKSNNKAIMWQAFCENYHIKLINSITVTRRL